MNYLSRNIEEMIAETRSHIEADAVAQGAYWDGNKGCFIGCLTHSDNARAVTERFGMPLPLVVIAEHIFEALPKADAVDFFANIATAIGKDGKDLSFLHWEFLGDVLESLPEQSSENRAVISGMRLLASGGVWNAAAAHAAGRADEVKRQAAVLLKLLKEA